MRLPAILLPSLVAAAMPIAGAAAMGAVPFAPAIPAPGLTKAGYFCSPGFEVSGSRCVATVSRDEVDLYLNETFGDAVSRRHLRHRHHRHGLRELY